LNLSLGHVPELLIPVPLLRVWGKGYPEQCVRIRLHTDKNSRVFVVFLALSESLFS
jgi:hypothetical protein